MKLYKLLNITVLFILMTCSSVSSELTTPLTNNNYHTYLLNMTGSSKDIPIAINNVKKIMIDVMNATQLPQVQLINPLGVVHTPDELNTYLIDYSEGVPLGALFFEPGHHIQMTVNAPTSGQWLLRLSLPQGATELIGNTSIIRQGGVAMNVFTSRRLYNKGQPVVIGSALFDDGVAVKGATIIAKIIQKSNISNVYTINLHDSGSTPDSAANDGLYTGTINDLEVGDYSVLAQATVSTGQLETVTDLRIIEPLGYFTRLVGDKGVDTNGDGLFEFIALNVEVEIFTSGKYELQGHLEVDNKDISAVNNLTLSTGIQTIDLLFKTDDIREYLKADGPYNIKDLMLVTRFNGIAGSNILADRRENLGQTNTYLLTELQRPPIQILPGITTSTDDYDNDQLIDRITTTFKVDLLVSGSFTWTGSLQSKNGTIFDISSGGSYLGKGQHDLSFSFPGILIGESGIDGPYYLSDVAIYGGGYAALSDEVGVTKLYLHTEFEGSSASFKFLRQKINSLIITGRGGKPRADGIRVSLLAKLDKAEKNALVNKINTAINILNALSSEINAQSGKHIKSSDASDLIAIIDKLSKKL